ncbi:hypothetical protein E2C01_092628 [Portunus trituberculatus]|uniref:Uncharacterized protein n=1 Tax=Portunus trituberculatus TaxID=210409 RepID=A0A5B7JVY3_PORTR|nr:hypothetical protein [Portunus trituberculatus]
MCLSCSQRGYKRTGPRPRRMYKGRGGP